MIDFTGTGPYADLRDPDDDTQEDFDPRDRDTFSWEDEDSRYDDYDGRKA